MVYTLDFHKDFNSNRVIWWKVFGNLNLDMYNRVFLQFLDSTGHRDFLRRIVLHFWYQHWTFIRELSWSSAHDYLLWLPEKQDHTHRWNPGHAHLWENDRGHPSLSGAWGVSTVGVRDPQGTRPEENCCFAFPPCFAVLRCDRGWWRACAGHHTEAVTKGHVRSVFSTMWKDLFILITIRELFKFLLYKMIYCIILFLFI